MQSCLWRACSSSLGQFAAEETFWARGAQELRTAMLFLSNLLTKTNKKADVNSLINTYLHFCPSGTPNIREMWDLVTFWCPCSWIVHLGLFTLNQGRDLVRMPCIFLTTFCNLCFLFCLSTKKCWILQHTNIFLCSATSAEQNERFPSEFSVQWRSSRDLLSQSLIPWLPAVWNVFRRLIENTVQLHQVSSVEYFGMFPCLTNEHVLLHASRKIL